jgi:glycosyltransferase involved in cell wall biosynthesis
VDSGNKRARAKDPIATILVASNSTWNLVHFRGAVLRELKRRGLRVVAVAPLDDSAESLARIGVEIEPVAINSRGVSPAADLRLVSDYKRVIERVRPDAFLAFTAKPNIYGSIAAQATSVPVVNTITGLGTSFLTGRILQQIVTTLYRFALKRSYRVFFHNHDDQELFLRLKIVSRGQADVVGGSGVDLDRFSPTPSKRASSLTTFLFVGRLLRDKGANEFAEAARTVKRQRPARFQMLGSAEKHPKAVSDATLNGWKSEGIVEVLGTVSDVRPMIRTADCVVLPSYREGLPRVLLEAAAMGKPVITTDVPGCRQAVRDGSTGLLCESRSPLSLARAMLRMIDMAPEERAAMGLRGRDLVRHKYSEDGVIGQYLQVLGEIGIVDAGISDDCPVPAKVT